MNNIVGSIIDDYEMEGCPFCGETETSHNIAPPLFTFACGFSSGKYTHHAPRIVRSACQKHSLEFQKKTMSAEQLAKFKTGVQEIKKKIQKQA